MLRIVAGIFLLFIWVEPAWADTSLTAPLGNSITWTPSRTVGQYANGDYYIVGSISITDKSPKDVDGVAPHLHGCEVNPEPPDSTSVSNALMQGMTHGLDSRIRFNMYSAALNLCAALPTATINAGSSIILGKSLTNCTQRNKADSQCIEAIDVVTVVSEAPPANSFRPPFAGTDKSFAATTASIRYNVLHDWKSRGALPKLAALESECIFLGPVYILSSGTQSWEKLAPTSRCNTPRGQGYGRATNWGILDVMAALNSNANDAAKQTMAVRIIQAAIDIYGQYNAGRWFAGAGGFCWAAKEVLVFGASLLNNEPMMLAAHPDNSGHRWCSTTIFKHVESSDVSLTRAPYCGANTPKVTTKCVAFTTEMIGRAQQCANFGNWIHNPDRCSAIVNPEYYWIASSYVGIAMILSKMSLEEEVGWPAFFEYLLSRNAWPDERYYSFAKRSNVGGQIPCIHKSNSDQLNIDDTVCELMDKHRDGAATDGSISKDGGGASSPQPAR